MSQALFRHERIKTTLPKAKEIRRVAEKIITKAKNKSLHNIRIIGKLIKDKEILMKLFDEISPRYAERNGGYTRIIKLGKKRADSSDMVYLELVEEAVQKTKKKKKKKKAAPKKAEAEEVKSEEVVEAAKEEIKEDAPEVKDAAPEKTEEKSDDETTESKE